MTDVLFVAWEFILILKESERGAGCQFEHLLSKNDESHLICILWRSYLSRLDTAGYVRSQLVGIVPRFAWGIHSYAKLASNIIQRGY